MTERVCTAPLAVMAAGLAFSTLTIASKFRAKSISIDIDDYKILMLLKQAGPSTPFKIAEMLTGIHIFGHGVWSEERVIERLTKLKELPEADGLTVKVVNESSDGRWSTAGF